MSNLDTAYSFAISQAVSAGEKLRQYRRSALAREYTTRSHFTTLADREIGDEVTREIARRFPDHDVHSEEGTIVLKGARYTWVCDPVDGTINLVTGFTDCVAFCLALCEDKQSILGVVNAPLRDGGELYRAVVGNGAFCNDVRISVSDETEISKVLMCTDSGKHNRTANLPFIEKLHGKNGITCSMAVGCASVPLVLVASGVLHAYLATSLEPEDMAAAVAIIREAGGKVTNLGGSEWQLGDASILAANPTLHEELSKFLGIPTS